MCASYIWGSGRKNSFPSATKSAVVRGLHLGQPGMVNRRVHLPRRRPRKALSLKKLAKGEADDRLNPKMSEEEEEGEEEEEEACSLTRVLETVAHLEEDPQQVEDDDGGENDETDDAQKEEVQSFAICPKSPPPDRPFCDGAVLVVPPVPLPPRRAPKRRKPFHPKKRTVAEKKLRLLRQTLRPVPFRHRFKTVNLSEHRELFTRLGLWDFAHLQLGEEIRSDLLLCLFAGYSIYQSLRFSIVNGQRIMLGRAHLARALKLPVKKDRGSISELSDLGHELFSEEAISVVEDFVLNYVLLHEDDTWLMPPEIMTSVKLIRAGHLSKVDFAGIIWFMVERELSRSPDSEIVCYYASHLQFLMRSQKPELFDEGAMADACEDDDGQEGVTTEETMDMTSEMKDSENLKPHGEEDNQANLIHKSMKEDNEQAHVRDFDGCKVEAREVCFTDRNCSPNREHCLRPCHSSLYKNDDEVDDAVETLANSRSLDSTHLIQGIAGTVSCGFPSEFDGSDGYAAAKADALKSLRVSLLNEGSSSLFQGVHKCENAYDERGSRFSLKDCCGRTGDNDLLDNRHLNFGLCMEQLQSWLCKSRAKYEEKEREYEHARMQVQTLIMALQQRDEYIQSLTLKIEEQSKREMDFYHLQRELTVMAELLDGYRKALRETRSAFLEYRKQFKHKEEPLYKDAGPGGMVLTVNDLENLLREKERVERIKLCEQEEIAGQLEQTWLGVFSQHLQKVDILNQRLENIEQYVKLLRDRVHMKIPSSEHCG